MTPRVMTLHSRFPFDRVQSWVGDADRFFLEWMMSMPMVAISQSARAEVEYPLNFVDVIHHGVPMHHFKPSVSHPENYLAWLGRFTPEKGARFAIEVARTMNIPLVLAGTVDRHMPESVRYFEEVIKPQVDGTLIKYIGPVDLPAKVNLLSRARGLLNPIIWEEPFGMVMIEAMAVGCPVVSFARGAAPEIVTHKKSGYLVHDVQEMIACVRCLEQIDRRIVFNHAEQNFSARIMAEKYVRLYRRICTTARVQSRPVPLRWQTTCLFPLACCLFPLPRLQLLRLRMSRPCLSLGRWVLLGLLSRTLAYCNNFVTGRNERLEKLYCFWFGSLLFGCHVSGGSVMYELELVERVADAW